MYNDFISKVASIFLILFFIGPDTFASIKGLQELQQGNIQNYNPSFKVNLHVEKTTSDPKSDPISEVETTKVEEDGKEESTPAAPAFKVASAEHFKIIKVDQVPEAQVYALGKKDMAQIAHTIKNVTRGAKGYGIRKSTDKLHHVSIGIHPNKILSVSRLKEVQVFYYDLENLSWQIAPIINIDHEKLNVEAMVPGNTDYFGGLINAPDMPEANAYLPTAVSGLEAASPATGMNLISPPDISHTGEAQINYPLALPPGRQGLTPSLGLSYNSDAGSGWLGVGWNINMPCVAVDTRWGVPTFPEDQEEIYTLNGSSLTMEGSEKGNRSSTDITRLTDNVRFFEPTANSYKEIVRKGASTSEYIWIETMPNQTKYYYGTLDGESKDGNYVIEANGHIVKWYLSRIIDKWGNEIRYNYDKVDYASSSNGLKKNGVEMVPSSIDYTLSSHAPNLNNYSVEFVSSNNRIDATVSLNTGTKIVNDHRLNSIKVKYNGTEVKRFDLQYGTGDFSKTQLQKIKEYRHQNFFYEHAFEYYSRGLTFTKQAEINVKNEGTFFEDIPDVLYSLSGKLGDLAYSSPITTTQTWGWGAGGSVGIGLAPGTIPKFDKAFTFSLNFDYSESYSRNKVNMADMNGDGLPDVIYDKSGSKKGYYPLQKSSNGSLSYGAKRKIDYSGLLMRSTSQAYNYGFGFTIGKPYSFSMAWTNSTSKTKVYTTDYNADGFPDLVVPKGGSSVVQFGRMGDFGTYTFGSSSESTPNPVYKNATITNSDDDDDKKDMEVVRIWEAPFDGTVSINNPATIPTSLTGEVYAAIQKNDGFSESFTRVMPGSPEPMAPGLLPVFKGDKLMFRLSADIDGQQDLVVWNPEIEYTTIDETNGSNSNFGVDANGLDYSLSTYEDGFLLSGGNSIFVAPDDDIKLIPNINITEPLTDDVTLTVRAIIYDESQQNPTSSQVLWQSTVLAGATTRSAFKDDQNNTPSFLAGAFGTIPGMNSDDYAYLTFEISSPSNVKWKSIQWYPAMEYQGEDCELVKTEKPIAAYHTYNKLEQYDLPVNFSPSAYSSTDQLQFKFSANSNPDVSDVFSTEEMSLALNQSVSKLIYATAKHNGKFLAMIPLEVVRARNGVGIYSNSISLSSTITYDDTFNWSEVDGTVNDIYYEFFVPNVNSDENLTNFFNTNNLKLGLLKVGGSATYSSQYSIYAKQASSLGNHYLHWGQFAWSDLDGTKSAILTSELVLSQQKYADGNELGEDSDFDALESNMEGDSDLEFANQKFFPLLPVRGDVTAAGLRTYIPDYNNDHSALTNSSLSKDRSLDRYTVFSSYIAAYASGGTCAPGILGEMEEFDLGGPVAQTPGDFGAYGIEQKTKSKQLSITNGVSFTTGGSKKVSLLNSTSLGSASKFFSHQKNLFTDLNGDGYPDILEQNSQYDATLTEPTGGFRDNTSNFNSSEISKAVSFQTAGVASGSHVNEDKRFTAGVKASLSFGSTDTKYDFIDINGDGLTDGVGETGSNGVFNLHLNKGGSLLSAVNHTYSNVSGLSASENFANSVGVSGSRTDMKPSSNSKIQGSIEGGVSLNNPGSRSERLFVDLNGDGLVDLIEVNGSPSAGLYASQNATVYINTGTDFVNYGNSINGADAFNKAEAHGFAGHIGGSISIPIFTFLVANMKLTIGLSLQANFAINEISSRLVDMNGDGMVDYVHALDNGKLDVYISDAGLSNKLKKVTNPLGGYFSIDYKLEGTKYGFKPTQIYTHVNSTNASNELQKGNEDMLWDMPFGKWVMSTLEVNDGYALPGDIDGVEKSVVYFNYDGGIKDRREREFYGFSRVEKKYLPSNAEHYTDYNAANNDNIHYITEVTEYEYPLEDGSEYRRKFYYLRNIVRHQYQYLNKLTKTLEDAPGGGDPIITYNHYLLPISVKNHEYEYRLVDLDTDLGKAKEIGSNTDVSLQTWETVSWPTIGESASIFPALIELTEQNYPQVATMAFKDKVLPRKFKIYYDKYFNVVRYADEGTTASPDIQRVLVGTITYPYYDYHTQTNYNSGEGSPVVTPDDFVNPVQVDFGTLDMAMDQATGQIGYVFPSGQPDFLNDTIFFDQPGPCAGSNIFNPEGIYVTIHRSEGVQTRTVNVYEDKDMSVYSGAVIADMEYFSPVNAALQIGVLKDHKIYLGSTTPINMKRHSEVSSLTQSNRAPGTLKNHLDASNFAQTDLTYDNFGNVTQFTGPANHKNQRMLVTFQYDSDIKQYVEQVTNSYNDVALYKYDLKTGNMLGQISINGQQTQYEYDHLDRLSALWAPREIGISGSAPTITYHYNPLGIDGTNPTADLEETIPVAFTKHNMTRQERSTYPVTTLSLGSLTDLSGRPSSISNPLNIATFTDGLGQTIQIKRETSSQGSTKRLVSGMSKLDQLRRPITATISILENISGSAPLGRLNVAVSTHTSQKDLKYDYVGRPLSGKNLAKDDNYTTATSEYSWNGSDEYYEQADAMVTSLSFIDARGRTYRKVTEGTNNPDIITEFEYDALNQLLRVTDPKSLDTDYEYDDLGRMTREIHPDRGQSDFTYDLTGNLRTIKTPVLGSSTIDMEYHYGRLIKKTVPEHGELYNVTYKYGHYNDGKNGAGRIVQVTQGFNGDRLVATDLNEVITILSNYLNAATLSSSLEFTLRNYAYDELGNLVKEKMEIYLPQSGSHDYTTRFMFDSWQRVLEMTYPDEEEVSYNYISGTGELQSIISTLSPYVFTSNGNRTRIIVEDIEYDGFENIGFLEYGNGTETRFTYSSTSRSLNNVYAEANDAINGNLVPMLDKTYTYDSWSRVSDVDNNNTQIPANIGIGGDYDFSYTYDEFNRLKTTSGSDNYSLTMTYNSDGSVHTRNQSVDVPISQNIETGLTTLTYQSNSHKLSSYTYNTNGSVIDDGTHEYIWNEEQQLMGVGSGSNGIAHYVYDHNGQRMLKAVIDKLTISIDGEEAGTILSGAPYLLYVNPYYIVHSFTDARKVSKHYYMNNQRVASEVMEPAVLQFQQGPLEEQNPTDGHIGFSQTPLGKNLEYLLDRLGETGDIDVNNIFNRDDIFDYYPSDLFEDLDEIPEDESMEDNGQGYATTSRVYFDDAVTESVHQHLLVATLYWYHPDYLGHVEFLTDRWGKPYQYFRYTPFGENMINERVGSSYRNNSRWRFNGKEYDAETGNYYYGARYYDPSNSMAWLSVDPLASEAPDWTPYRFSFNNPINFVDPTGLLEEPYLVFDGDKNELVIYDDNDTPDDYSDDVKVGTYKAHNNVASSSNGKWEDGEFEMLDKNTAHTHSAEQDSKDGPYGENGIFRAKSFDETAKDGKKRTGMGIHSGRAYKTFEKRVTMGCIRTTDEAIEGIIDAIEEYGPLQKVIVKNNLKSDNSGTVNKINPGPSNVPAPQGSVTTKTHQWARVPTKINFFGLTFTYGKLSLVKK